MDLPKLTPGKRFTLPRPSGAADALLLAQLASREKAAGRLTAIVTADATDAQRLIDEMAFFAPGLRCALFPDWETLPYDTFSPHQDLISERLATLWRIQQHDKDTGADVVLVPATTALYRLAPPSFLAGYTFQFKVKQKLDEAKLKGQLTLAGYQHVTQVVSPGEYAVRGGLIDLFPMGSQVPYRVDLFDDEIDSIRTFDPDSQRSLYPVPEVRLLPGREFPMDDAARAKFRNRWRELLDGDPTKSRIYKDMGNGVATAGIEYYLPLFFDDTATVFDYLGGEATVVLHGDLEPAFQRFWQDTKDRFRLVQGDPERPTLPPEALFLSSEQFYAGANTHAQLSLRRTEVRAPSAGRIAQADRLQVGQQVVPNLPVLTLVREGSTYVEANFKETDLADMAVGQRAEVRFDAYPDLVLKGRVASIGAGTGAEFSVLPAQNATGNWVKVTQRIPVTVSVEVAWAMKPAAMCATELDRNQTPIIRPTTRSTDSLVIIDRPTGDRHSSPIVCRK